MPPHQSLRSFYRKVVKMFDRIAGIIGAAVDALAITIVIAAGVLAFWATFGDEPEWLDRPTDPFAEAVEYMP